DRERDVLVTLTDYTNTVVAQFAESDRVFPLADYPQTRQVMTDRVPVVVRTSDPGCDPNERRILEAEGYCSRPMLHPRSRGEPIGLMEIADVRDRDWDDDVEFFRALTDVLGVAVHNAVLHDEARSAERRYRVLVEHLPAITYVDAAGSGDPIYVSPQIEQLMG